MPLDDFFAKKEKKKIKKKQNPQDLIERLTNETFVVKDNEGDKNLDLSKSAAPRTEDEWATIDDDEKEIDLQSMRIGKLEIESSEDSNKTATRDKNNINDTDKVDERKVWSVKRVEEPIVVLEPEPVPDPVPVQSKTYVPVHLRSGDAKALPAVKPCLDSKSDFPSLDDAATKEVPPKKKVVEIDDGGSWSQAGEVRKTNPMTQQPNQSKLKSSSGSSYAPPSLRNDESALQAARMETTGRYNSRFQNDRYSSGGFVRGSEAPRSTLNSNSDWSRGTQISQPPNINRGSSSSAFTAPSRPSNSGWDRGVCKTFREPDQGKTDFQLTQSNRFAGFSET